MAEGGESVYRTVVCKSVLEREDAFISGVCRNNLQQHSFSHAHLLQYLLF